MKKKFILLFLLLGLSFLGLQAQTEKGNLLVNASTSELNFSSAHHLHSFSANLNASVGYFVIKNLAAGLRFGTAFSTYNDPQNRDYSTFGVALSAFGRYYIPLGQRLKIPVDAHFGISTGNSKTPYDNSRTSLYTFGAHTGLSYFFNSHASIDLTVGYNGYKVPNSTRIPAHFGGLGAQLGFSLYLGSKNKGQ